MEQKQFPGQSGWGSVGNRAVPVPESGVEFLACGGGESGGIGSHMKNRKHRGPGAAEKGGGHFIALEKPELHFREEAVLGRLEEALGGRKVDLVVSDMAPNLSGVAVADAARMSDLIEIAVDFAQAHLKPDGALLVKCFHGSGYSQLVERFRKVFVKVAPRKPKASRDKSAETYLLGRSLKQAGGIQPSHPDD